MALVPLQRCKPEAVFATFFGPFSCVLLATWVPAHLCPSHTWAPPPPSPGWRLELCAGKALGPEGRSRHPQTLNW